MNPNKTAIPNTIQLREYLLKKFFIEKFFNNKYPTGMIIKSNHIKTVSNKYDKPLTPVTTKPGEVLNLTKFPGAKTNIQPPSQRKIFNIH